MLCILHVVLYNTITKYSLLKIFSSQRLKEDVLILKIVYSRIPFLKRKRYGVPSFNRQFIFDYFSPQSRALVGRETVQQPQHFEIDIIGTYFFCKILKKNFM